MHPNVRIATVSIHSPTNQIDWRANANLIVAAPDLLEAARELKRARGHASDNLTRGLDLLMAALNKAEGQA